MDIDANSTDWALAVACDQFKIPENYEMNKNNPLGRIRCFDDPSMRGLFNPRVSEQVGETIPTDEPYTSNSRAVEEEAQAAAEVRAATEAAAEAAADATFDASRATND
jgi:hypothetical protein